MTFRRSCFATAAAEGKASIAMSGHLPPTKPGPSEQPRAWEGSLSSVDRNACNADLDQNGHLQSHGKAGPDDAKADGWIATMNVSVFDASRPQIARSVSRFARFIANRPGAPKTHMV